MRIQHNIMAMNAYRNYNTNTSALSKNLEKLSSGYKINRAGDDAAGLAISEKMRAQITGLNAAQKNVKDGISLVKTAEGAMQEIQDMLNRMDYLATQSANGTYDDPVDRANLQKEVDSLKSEINRIADSANFNGINLLDGTWAKTVASTDPVDPDKPLDPSKFDMTAVDMKEVKIDKTSKDPVKGYSVDGVARNPANAFTIKFAVASGVNLSRLDSLTITDAMGSAISLSDFFDIKVNGQDFNGENFADLGSGGMVDERTTIELTAKNVGRLSDTWNGGTLSGLANQISTQFNALTFGASSDVKGAATNAGGDYLVTMGGLHLKIVDGNNIGETSVGGGDNATYDFKIDLKELLKQGGANFTAGGKMSFVTSDVAATVGYKYDGTDKESQIYFGDLSLNDVDHDVAKDAWDTLLERFEGALDANTELGGKFEYDDLQVDENGILTFRLTAKDATVDPGHGDGTGSNAGAVDIDKDIQYSDAITVESATGLDGTPGKPAGMNAMSVYKLDAREIKAGNAFSVGGVTIEIVKDDDERLNDQGIAKGLISEDVLKDLLVDTSKYATTYKTAGTNPANSVDTGAFTHAEKHNLLNMALQSAGYKGGDVVVSANNTISVISKVKEDMKAEDWAKGLGKVEVGTPKAPVEEPTEPTEPTDPPKGGKALTLQIGDTAEEYNQLRVNIGDMHVKAMGFELDEDGNITSEGTSIQDIDISSLEGAQDAIKTIKNAINYVSSIRGDLGATQNRLEHTANNLSVMAENIQDAESTIRDTDVAEEMMAYTKNNILIQSAQAMLAQANAVPQGVLQLLG